MRVTGHKTASMFRRYSIVTDDNVAAAEQLARWGEGSRCEYGASGPKAPLAFGVLFG